jgi:hypothetical protein
MSRPIPAVNQVWDVNDGQLVAIVSIESDALEGITSVPPIKGMQGDCSIAYVRYSDGLTGFYSDNISVGCGWRLVWCPFGQHETNKERETT